VAEAADRSPEAVVRDLVEAWNSHDIERICGFFHDDFENWQAPLPLVQGLAAYRRHLEHWFAAYPELRLEIVTLVAAGDRVCLETRATGTPSSTFFGVVADGESGERENRALGILELREGRVWRERGYWDFSMWIGKCSPLARLSVAQPDAGNTRLQADVPAASVAAGPYAPPGREVL
jgi:limonene-1,2-epoxide hydrolase